MHLVIFYRTLFDELENCSLVSAPSHENTNERIRGLAWLLCLLLRLGRTVNPWRPHLTTIGGRAAPAVVRIRDWIRTHTARPQERAVFAHAELNATRPENSRPSCIEKGETATKLGLLISDEARRST